jgi:hypothetical protein
MTISAKAGRQIPIAGLGRQPFETSRLSTGAGNFDRGDQHIMSAALMMAHSLILGGQ